jgi:hypothetical protein
MRVARIQGRVFQQAQAPRLRRVRPAAAQPVAAVVGISAQVFPRQRRAVKVQNVEIGRCRIPVFGAAISHGETSSVWDASPRFPRCGNYRNAIRSSSKLVRL